MRTTNFVGVPPAGADREGKTVFEGTTVHFTVAGDVVCQAGWAFARVTGYSIDYIVLRYQAGKWQWAPDPYWNQFGAWPSICDTVPSKLHSALRCP